MQYYNSKKSLLLLAYQQVILMIMNKILIVSQNKELWKPNILSDKIFQVPNLRRNNPATKILLNTPNLIKMSLILA